MNPKLDSNSYKTQWIRIRIDFNRIYNSNYFILGFIQTNQFRILSDWIEWMDVFRVQVSDRFHDAEFRPIPCWYVSTRMKPNRVLNLTESKTFNPNAVSIPNKTQWICTQIDYNPILNSNYFSLGFIQTESDCKFGLDQSKFRFIQFNSD